MPLTTPGLSPAITTTPTGAPALRGRSVRPETILVDGQQIPLEPFDEPLFGDPTVCDYVHSRVFLGRNPSRSRWTGYHGSGPGPELWEHFLTFPAVRAPWDELVEAVLQQPIKLVARNESTEAKMLTRAAEWVHCQMGETLVGHILLPAIAAAWWHGWHPLWIESEDRPIQRRDKLSREFREFGFQGLGRVPARILAYPPWRFRWSLPDATARRWLLLDQQAQGLGATAWSPDEVAQLWYTPTAGSMRTPYGKAYAGGLARIICASYGRLSTEGDERIAKKYGALVLESAASADLGLQRGSENDGRRERIIQGLQDVADSLDAATATSGAIIEPAGVGHRYLDMAQMITAGTTKQEHDEAAIRRYILHQTLTGMTENTGPAGSSKTQERTKEEAEAALARFLCPAYGDFLLRIVQANMARTINPANFPRIDRVTPTTTATLLELQTIGFQLAPEHAAIAAKVRHLVLSPEQAAEADWTVEGRGFEPPTSPDEPEEEGGFEPPTSPETQPPPPAEGGETP